MVDISYPDQLIILALYGMLTKVQSKIPSCSEHVLTVVHCSSEQARLMFL